MTSEFSWQNSVSLCFSLYSKAKFACYFRYVLTSYFCIPVSSDEKDIFFWVLVLEGLVGHHRTVQHQLLWHQWLGIDLDNCEFVWFALKAFPGGSEVKASACNAGELGSIPGLGRSPGERNGNPLQYSCLDNPMDGGAWWATVHGVAKSRT